MKKQSFNYPQSILIITHFFTTGPAVELRDFLHNKVENLTYISHPFSFALGDKRSTITFYKKGKQTNKKFFPFISQNELLLFCKDFIASLFFTFNCSRQFDICVASDNLNALAALMLKKIGKIKRVIYYNIDYTPTRFHNPFLNAIYHAIDRYCCYHADLNWIGTVKTNESRKRNSVKMQRMSPTIIVPDGNHAFQVAKRTKKKRNTDTIVFVGHITKKQGLDLVIESLPELLRWNKKLRLIVIGTGDYEKNLHELAKKKKVENAIDWKGQIESHEEVENILIESGIGLAPYVPDKDSFTNFSEAGKPKLYLGCGLPVILTAVPSISKEIEKKKAGIIVLYQTNEFINAVKYISKDEQTYKNFQTNAKGLGLQFDWSTIFEKALFESFSHI